MSFDTFTILGLAGSLRRQSYNHALLNVAREVAPPHVRVQVFDLNGLPMFNEDLELGEDPPAVQALKTSIAQADAILIATPEHNYSIPAALKNAIDWASRSPDETPSVLYHRPVAIMGATVGGFGTVRAQLALRQVLHYTESYVLLKPEVHVPRAFERFGADGTLRDEKTREAVRALVEALVTWAEQVGRTAGHSARSR